jgi:rhamnose transport system substrate-binding protein
MIRKTAVVAALALSVAGLAATSAAARHRPFTIVYITSNAGGSRVQAIARGSRAAAKTLGVRYMLSPRTLTDQGVIPYFRSMIARHVDAIVSDGYAPALKPIFAKVLKAGILLLSSGDDIAGARDLWVNESDPVTYGRALADALASQIADSGEYAILEEQDQYPIADAWEKVVASYVATAYPSMKLDGVIDGTGAGDEQEVTTVKNFMSSHPNLKGFVAVTPTESYMAAEAIQQAGRIGQVFSAGNGDGTFDDLEPGFVRSGAAELVFGGDPMKLGYLTVWAANYLLTGHRFRPGAYQVGGPIGLVYYYAEHQELRLGQPLTITKANVDIYANTF